MRIREEDTHEDIYAMQGGVEKAKKEREKNIMIKLQGRKIDRDRMIKKLRRERIRG